MAVPWSHLPKNILPQVCLRHTKNCGKGFKLIPATGWWVCTGCGNPTVQNAVKECDICEKIFVPKMYEKAMLDFLGIMCDECDPPS